MLLMPTSFVGAQEPSGIPPHDDLRFRCVGPTRGGRVTTVAGVRQRPGTYFMGASGGGVWKTTDFGHSWDNVSDGFLDSPSIGAIRVAPSDPDVVWVGTGSDGLRSNVIAGCGVYRSEDAGRTWQHLGLTETRHIGAIEVHPFNPDVAFVAAIGNAFAPNDERGVYRTIDGGDTWDRVLFVSERTGFADLEFCPADPKIVYAAAWQAERKPWTIESGGDEGGIWRSTDAGHTWQKLGGGLPEGLIGKIDLAVTPADPTRLYALVEAPGDAGGLYVSVDGGESFRQRSSDEGIRNRPFYYTNLDVCPEDPERLYVCAMRFLRSTDGGRSWQSQSTPHGDHHDLWIHPDHPDWWIQGNDGGATVTLDAGRSWSTLDNQPTAELYQVAVDNRFPYWLYAGQQDNSTIRVPSFAPHTRPGGATAYWEAVGGCETGPAVPDPRDADIVYANCKGRFGVYDHRTGQERHYEVGAANMYGHDPARLRYRFQRVAPIHVSPHDPDLVFHASQFVHVTADRGVHWQTISPDLTANDPRTQAISGTPITRDITGEEFHSTIYALRESPRSRGTIWVGANDGPVHVTRDGGKTWRDVTPPEVSAAVAPHGRVDCVEPSPHAPDKAFVCVLRYQLDDWRPLAFRTTDGGATWTRVTGPDSGVPQDEPVRVLREDPAREGLLYLGTERGLYVSFDDGGHWQPLRHGLPVVPVTDLVVHGRDLVVSTMGRSFWILDDLTPLRAEPRDLAGATVHLHRPAVAHRVRARSGRGIPESPEFGAVVDYVLAEAAGDAPLTLEIVGPDGAVLRRFHDRRPERETADAVFVAVDDDGLSREPGHNRFVWDLRHAGVGTRDGKDQRRGPMVRPGRYELRLRLGEIEARRPLEVALDPRVAAAGITGDDVAAQEGLQLELRAVYVSALRVERTQSARLAGMAKEHPDYQYARRIRELLVTADGAYPEPKLLDQLRYLDGLLDHADQRPGEDAVERLDELRSMLRGFEPKSQGD